MFSLQARGKIGPLIIEQRREGQYIRSRQPIKGPPSEKQKAMRKLYGQAVGMWKALPPDLKEVWNIKANLYRISGFNLFLKYFTSAPQIAIYGVAIYGLNKYGQKGE